MVVELSFWCWIVMFVQRSDVRRRSCLCLPTLTHLCVTSWCVTRQLSLLTLVLSTSWLTLQAAVTLTLTARCDTHSQVSRYTLQTVANFTYTLRTVVGTRVLTTLENMEISENLLILKIVWKGLFRKSGVFHFAKVVRTPLAGLALVCMSTAYFPNHNPSCFADDSEPDRARIWLPTRLRCCGNRCRIFLSQSVVGWQLQFPEWLASQSV